MGETRPVPGVSVVPLNKLEDGGEDGCFVNQKCMGSYIPVSYTHLDVYKRQSVSSA